MSQLLVPVSVNDGVTNKVPAGEMVKLQRGFSSQTLCCDDIASHVLEGHAFVPAWLDHDAEGKSIRKNTAFQKAQLIFLDIDNSITENGIKRRQTDEEGYTPLEKVVGNAAYQDNAFLIYTSPSHTPEWHRYRIVFCLPEPVRDVERYKQIVAAFISRIGADPACKSPVHIFYGNTKAEVFPFGNVLSQNFVDGVVLWASNIEEEERVASEHINGALTADHVREMLKFLPPKVDYKDWIRIISGLRTKFDEETTVSLVEEWSPGKPGEVRAKLRSGLGSGRVGIGTVIYICKQYGYKPPREIFKDTKDLEEAGLLYKGVRYRLTQAGNGERFVDAYRDRVRYCVEQKLWYVWDGKRLVAHRGSDVSQLALQCFRDIIKEAAEVPDARQAADVFKWAKSSESKTTVENSLYFARSGTRLTVLADKLDAKPLCLNLNNGIFDLETMLLCEHDIEELHTKIIPIDYIEDAECPKWLEFLDTIFAGDQELIEWMQKAVGYTLSALTSEECLFFAYGSGANGKSIFFSVLDMLMGGPDGYSHKAKTELVMMRKGDPLVPMDIAELRGRRFVYTDELTDNKRFDESKIKDITSHDRLNGRMIYQETITFNPTHKLWMYGNHRPTITGQDEGIWRRLHLIPFTVTIPDEKKRPPEELKAEFQAEISGILRWALTGFKKWRDQKGLRPLPKVIAEATKDYRSDMDTIGAFIAEEVAESVGASIPHKVLYARYKAWCQEQGITYVMTSKKLTMSLAESKGWKARIDRKGYREWLERSLVSQDPSSMF